VKGFKGSNRYIIYFWIGFLIVIFLNVFVWVYLNQVDKQFENELKNKLLSMSTLISRLIDESEVNAILPNNQQSIEYIYYQQLLDDISQDNDLQSILIVSPNYEILVSAPEILTNQRFINLQTDRIFNTALHGVSAVSDIQNYAGEKFMSAYTPIKDVDGFVIAVLSIEAKANYFHIINNLRNRLLVFSLINSILIIMIAFFLFRMIKKSIQYQTEIKEQERLVQLGTMAATVAHELRNPLNIIEATNDIIQKKYSKNDDELFSFIPEEVKRLSVLIDNFLQFARNPELNIENKTIVQLIDRIKLNFSEHDNARLQISILDDPDTAIKTDHSQLEQALINLIKNALEASNHDEGIKIIFESLKKDKVKITIEDQGSGIQADLIDKVFDPFFTTKEKGTGLGLSITKRIIDQLNGNINIQSKEGKGTKIEFIIPKS
jgi:two-component system, sporulation sensor kinase D